MSQPTVPATVGILLGLCLGASALAAHPLDPLTADELKAVGEVLRADGLVDDGTRFPQIRLEDPEKAKVLAWRPGAAALPRQAFAVLRQDGAIREAVVDLDSKKVVSLTAREGAQSPVLFEEWGSAQEATLADPRFMEALAKRGVTDKDKVFCAPFSMGYFGVADHEGRRLLKVGCFDLRPSVNSMFGWPIEGLYAVVDLHAGKVIELHDSGVVPISPAEMNFAENSLPSLRDPLKPVTVATPSGANVSIDGHTVGWQNWRFHVALDRRVGMTLSTVSYAGRPILYRAYQSEMFVPYHDPDYGWYSRTYFDTGEYGAGLLTTPLQADIDCPANAYFMGATINDDTGGPLEIPNAICIFERNTGDPVWRHAEPLNQTHEGRPDVELVARFVPTIGNYDYVIDFVFDLAGEITIRVGATGIDALKGVKSASMADATAAADTEFGTLVAPHLVAVNHDHFINFRLDIDIDGPDNTLVRDAYVKQRLDGARRSIYRIETQPVAAETGISLGHQVAKWRVLNERTTNAVGNPTGYELVHHAHTPLLLDEDDWPAKRGAFAGKDLWVTPYDPRQRYAGGDYVFGSTGDDGLKVWTEAGRPVAGQDLVLWVNMAFNHMTRAEDLPVMPTNWHEFKIRPFNFHDANPALDLRAQFAGP
jgi:primary-amine oxidase